MSFSNLKFGLSQTCKSKVRTIVDLCLHAYTGVTQSKHFYLTNLPFCDSPPALLRSIMDNADKIFRSGFEASSSVLAWTHAEPLSDLFITDMDLQMHASVVEYPDMDMGYLASEDWNAVVENSFDCVVFALDISGKQAANRCDFSLVHYLQFSELNLPMRFCVDYDIPSDEPEVGTLLEEHVELLLRISEDVEASAKVCMLKVYLTGVSNSTTNLHYRNSLPYRG